MKIMSNKFVNKLIENLFYINKINFKFKINNNKLKNSKN